MGGRQAGGKCLSVLVCLPCHKKEWPPPISSWGGGWKGWDTALSVAPVVYPVLDPSRQRTKMRSLALRLVVVLLPGAHSLRLLSPPVSPRVLRATRPTMAEISPSERLASLEKTLVGLREGGYAKEMLEPLQREIELLKVTAVAAPDTPPAAPPAAAPTAATAPPPTPVFVRPFDPDTGAGVGLEPPSSPPTNTAQPTPAFVRPFNPDSDGDEEASPPPSPPRKRDNGMNSLRKQTERNYVPAEGLNPAAELLRRRQEARRERGEPSGGGGGGGWFAGLGLSPEAKAARDQVQAAAVSQPRLSHTAHRSPRTHACGPCPPTPAVHVHPRRLPPLGSARARRRRQRPSRRRSWRRPPSGARRKPRCSQSGRVEQVGPRSAVAWRIAQWHGAAAPGLPKA